MKQIISVLVCLITACVLAGPIQLEWTPPCGTNIVGFHVYFGWMTNKPVQLTTNVFDVDCEGIAHAHYDYGFNLTNSFTVGYTNSCNIIGLVEGRWYYFAMTSMDAASNESWLSSQAYIYVPITYTNGGPLPTITIGVGSYQTNYFTSPIISTNKHTGAVFTNYYSLSVKTLRLCDDLFIPTNWTMLRNTNLLNANWIPIANGSNSVVDICVTNDLPSQFFRLKF